MKANDASDNDPVMDPDLLADLLDVQQSKPRLTDPTLIPKVDETSLPASTDFDEPLSGKDIIDNLSMNITDKSRQGNVQEVQIAIIELLDFLQQRPTMKSLFRGHAYARVVNYCIEVEDIQAAIDCATKAEEIYAHRDCKQRIRISNLASLGRIYFEQGDYPNLDMIITSADKVVLLMDDPEQGCGAGTLNHLKLQFYSKVNRRADELKTLRSLNIYVLSTDDIAEKVAYKLREAWLLYNMRCLLGAFEAFRGAIRMLQRDPTIFISLLSNISKIHIELHTVLERPSLYKPFIKNIPSICYHCDKSCQDEVYQPCESCKTVEYCSPECRDANRDKHHADCIAIVQLRSRDNKDVAKELKRFYLLLQLAQTSATMDRVPVFYRSVDELCSVVKRLPDFDKELSAYQCHIVSDLCMRRGSYEAGLVVCKLAEELNPQNSPNEELWALICIARAYLCLKLKIDDSIEDTLTRAEEVLRQEKYAFEYVRIPFNDINLVRGTLYIRQERYKEALDALRKVPTTRDVETLPCKLLEITLLYMMKYFIRADMLCDTLLEYFCKDVDSLDQLRALKAKTSQAMLDGPDHQHEFDEMPRVCAGCWQLSIGEDKFSRCSGCYGAYYCGVKCQEERWPDHKKFCLRYRKR